MDAGIEVGIDIGGSGTRIKAFYGKSTNPFINIQNQTLFSNRKKCAQKLGQAIISLCEQNFNKTDICLVSISITGEVDHKNNILILSHRLSEVQANGAKYQNYELAKQLKIFLKNTINKQVDVYLVNDSLPACLCPRFSERLVLTLVLGTYPIIGLSEKGDKIGLSEKGDKIKLYRSFVKSWVDELILSTGWQITQELKGVSMKKRDDQTNRGFIVEAVVKILEKYQIVFKWQPDTFIILGGFATCLKKIKWPHFSKVKIQAITSYEQSVNIQIQGALNYGKIYSKVQLC